MFACRFTVTVIVSLTAPFENKQTWLNWDFERYRAVLIPVDGIHGVSMTQEPTITSVTFVGEWIALCSATHHVVQVENVSPLPWRADGIVNHSGNGSHQQVGWWRSAGFVARIKNRQIISNTRLMVQWFIVQLLTCAQCYSINRNPAL